MRFDGGSSQAHLLVQDLAAAGKEIQQKRPADLAAAHRIGTMEVESALVDHPHVAEAAVVGIPHEIKGTAIAAFVTLKDGQKGDGDLVEELKEHVVKKIGAIARPEKILFAHDLPKTRSGKIMRRLLRDIASGRETVGDTTTLEDYSVIARLRADEE